MIKLIASNVFLIRWISIVNSEISILYKNIELKIDSNEYD